MNASDICCTVAVAIFGFNRPDCLAQVFERVKTVKPQKLFLVLDAPRANRMDDIPKVDACKCLLEEVDWDCEVLRNYATENMGCRWRMTTGISWVFEHVDRAILLEDDCVPHIDFFRFCTELLERYKDDMRVGMIAGMLAHFEKTSHTPSYYFDRFNTSCGWATWRRAWETFDKTMESWPRFKQTGNLKSVLGSDNLTKMFMEFFDNVRAGANTWATAWFYSCIRQNFLCIHPSVNLITNVGVEGAHNSGRSQIHFIPSDGIVFPLIHPQDVIPSYRDEEAMRRRYGRPSVLKRIGAKIYRMFRQCCGMK